MRHLKFDARRHRDRSGDRGTRHQRRDHPERIARREGDRAFGDEGEAQDSGGASGFPLFGGEAVAEQAGGKGHGQRRHHARRHRRGHRRIDLAGDQADREGITRLVDRPAHVEGRHRAQDHPQQDRARSLHGAQPLGEEGEGGGNRRADCVDHQQAGQQRAQQRQEQHRLQAREVLRELDQPVEPLDAVTGDETGDDPAQEARAEIGGQHAADHARRDTRTVGDGIGDIARERRHDQREAALRADAEQRIRQRALGRRAVGIDATQSESHGNQQAACDHEGQHEGNAGHQVLVGTGAFGAGRACLGREAAALRFRFGQRPFDQRPAAGDGRLGAGGKDPLAGEARAVHLTVRGDDDHVGCRDFFGRQRRTGTDRTLRLHADRVAELFRAFLKPLGGHERMGDAGGA